NMYKRNTRQLTCLSQRLAGDNPTRTFADNCEKTMPDWITLLRETTLPCTIVSSAPLITNAFKVVDRVISTRESTNLLRRLAYFQLMRLFRSLEAIIESEGKGLNYASSSSHTRIAMDIYIGAQEWPRQPSLRRKITEQRRQMGERIVAIKNLETSSKTLQRVATEVQQACPKQLVPICYHLTKMFESAARQRRPLDIKNISTRINKALMI
ncbi:hypothetical protein F5883DRAFT_431631, partial [Diaporthe sp. PMI_573]